MKIVTYNIQFCRGKDLINDPERICSEIQGADIICLQEVDRFWPRSDERDQLEIFMNAFPDFHVEYGAGVNLGAESRNADNPPRHQRRQFGNLTLSRYPIAYSRHHLLPKRASTGPISIQRSALECVILAPGEPFRIINTHLTHLSGATRQPQVERLLAIHREAEHEGEPVSGDMTGSYWTLGQSLPQPPRHSIMLGDFNFEPDSDNYTRFVGPACDYGGRISSPAEFMDARVAAGYDENDGFTSDVNDRPARLDHIFISPVLSPRVKDCWIDSEAMGSDHQPMWLDIED